MAKDLAVITIGKATGDDEDAPDGLPVPMPEQLEPPDGVEPGETFQVMADVRLDDNGETVLEKLDGKPVGVPKSPSPPDDKPEPPAKKPSLISEYGRLMQIKK